MNQFNIKKPLLSLNYINNLKICKQWKSWSSKDVRSTFINYFVSEGHEFIPSSSVIPKKREGTYFINSGMNQFKPIFLGQCDPTSKFFHIKKAVNSQKCIRVGGKHNDLDDVGHDLTHHTFFEMLGNWSFGDYFKEKACQMAYRLLTKEFNIPIERLYFTYFGGDTLLNLSADEDCKQIWLSLGIPANRILPFGLKDNFWEMGLTGPCGPCTEIHYDHRGTICDTAEVNSGSPQVVELWNLVFMQYNRLADSSLVPLPNFHVDTGMGLERMVAVLNGTSDNYRTDLFLPLFKEIHKLSGCPEYKGSNDILDTNYRILADHSRMFTVAISDGLLPSQDNLGHKLRSLLLRCVDLCQKVFHTDPLTTLPVLVSTVKQTLGPVYPELELNEKKVCDVVKATIHHYDKHKELAMKSFSKMLTKQGSVKVLSGEIILSLEQGHFGSPMALDMISELAASHGIEMDMDNYRKVSQNKTSEVSAAPLTPELDRASVLVNHMIHLGVKPTDDSFKYTSCSLGDGVYDFNRLQDIIGSVHVKGMSKESCVCQELQETDAGEVILDKTCFYGQAGGQESDKGELVSESGTFQVTDVQIKSSYVVHYGHMSSGKLSVGQMIEPRLSQEVREGCMRNHTATHLLNSALSQVLPSTQQQGSSITSHKLTFDFLLLSSLDSSYIKQIEDCVRNNIKKEYQVSRRIVPLTEAVKIPNLKMLQNEEYPEEVSVISVGPVNGSFDSSVELCGGTHVLNTSDLEDFCITQISSKSQNVKRITCMTGPEAKLAHLNGHVVMTMCQLLQDLLTKLNEISQTDVKKFQRLVQQVIHAVSAHLERTQHNLNCSNETVSSYRKTLENLKEEDLKVLSLLQTLNETLRQIGMKGHEHALKQLILLIRKYKITELLPKLVRDEAQSCLDKSESKVTEILNKKTLGLINQMIEHEMNKFPSSSVVSVTLDDIDINNRQITKSLSQKVWQKGLILINKFDRSADLFICLPLSSFQLLNKEDLENLKTQLKVTVKGKLASQNNDVAVYKFLIQGDINDKDIFKLCSGQFRQK